MTSNQNILIRRLKASYLSSVISISLVLIIVGAICVIAANAKNVAKYFKENMVVSVILKQSVTESQAKELEAQFKGENYVKSAEYISKEQGEMEMKALLGEDFLSVFESSPIPYSIDLHLDGDVVTSDSLSVITERILTDPKIEEVTYQESLVDMMNANMKQIGTTLVVIVMLLTFISFVLINNTVRLNVFSKRFTIHTMRLVGAKKMFICKPFIRNSMILGLISGIIASAVIVLSLIYSSENTEFVKSIFDTGLTASVLVGDVFFGVLICGISALFVTHKLVDMSKDDLYI